MTRPGPTPQQRLLVDACFDNGVVFFWRGPGTLLIDKSGLPLILPQVLAAGATILGFEGFEMKSTDIHPRLDLIFDASLGPDAGDPTTAVSNWPDDVWVDVTLRVGGAQ